MAPIKHDQFKIPFVSSPVVLVEMLSYFELVLLSFAVGTTTTQHRVVRQLHELRAVLYIAHFFIIMSPTVEYKSGVKSASIGLFDGKVTDGTH